MIKIKIDWTKNIWLGTTIESNKYVYRADYVNYPCLQRRGAWLTSLSRIFYYDVAVITPWSASPALSSVEALQVGLKPYETQC